MTAKSTYLEAKLRSNGLKQVKMENRKSSLMITFISVFWQGLWVPVGLKQGAENSSILRALVANRRGAKRPHFGKQGYNLAYSPHEPKRMDLRVFL